MNYIELQTVKYESFENEIPMWSEGQQRYLSTIESMLEKDSAILDVACGDGSGLKWFLDNKFTNVTGCEINPRKASKARSYGYPIIEQDLHELELPKESFDVIYSSHTLEHAINPTKALKGFHRLLKPYGKLFIVLPYPDKGPLDAHCGKIELHTDPDSIGIHGSKKLIETLSECGFSLLSETFDSVREPEIWLRLKKL